MFDDVQQPNNQATTPGNLPVGEPEDMFESTDTTAMTPPETVQDTISQPVSPAPTIRSANTVSALDAGILKPKEPQGGDLQSDYIPSYSQANQPADLSTNFRTMPRVAEPVNPQPMVNAQAYVDDSSSGGGKGVLVFIVVLLLLIIVGGGGWYVYTQVIQKKTETPKTTNIITPPPAPVVEQPNIVDQPTNETQTSSQDDIDDQILFGEPIDTDEDGLDDTREQELGTSIDNWDTDDDDLGDGVEVLVWKTNPLLKDTDGDTYADGQEVRSGYSPVGTGKLIAPVESTTTSPFIKQETVSSSQ